MVPGCCEAAVRVASWLGGGAVEHGDLVLPRERPERPSGVLVGASQGYAVALVDLVGDGFGLLPGPLGHPQAPLPGQSHQRRVAPGDRDDRGRLAVEVAAFVEVGGDRFGEHAEPGRRRDVGGVQAVDRQGLGRGHGEAGHVRVDVEQLRGLQPLEFLADQDVGVAAQVPGARGDRPAALAQRRDHRGVHRRPAQVIEKARSQVR